MYESYIYLQDKKASGVDGGTSTSGSWETRDLTDEVVDTDNLCTLAANQFTLQPGTYRCLIFAPAYKSIMHQIRLYNITDAALEILGTSEWNADGVDRAQTRTFLKGRFTIAVQKTFEIQHQVGTSIPNLGHGVGNTWGDNIYTMAEFWKESGEDDVEKYGPRIQVI